MPLRKCVILCVLLCCAATAGAYQAGDEAYRLDAMDREMDCISRRLNAGGNVTWEDSCSSQLESPYAGATGPYDPGPLAGKDTPAYDTGDMAYPGPATGEYAQYARVDPAVAPESYGDFISGDDADWDDEYSAPTYAGDSDGWFDPALTTFDVGIDLESYRYNEPEFMRYKGYMFGLFGAVTWRTSENKHIRRPGDIFSEDNRINMYRIDARFSLGDLDYESDGTGTQDNVRHYNFESRGLFGYDIPFGEDNRVTPYLGIGLRYLKDDGGGSETTTGAFAYDRQSFYYYIPIGLETRSRLAEEWLLEFTFEYDYFLAGKQYSHYEDGDPGFNTLENNQDQGYGARGSFRVIKENRMFDVYLEPFVRYWNIEDSDIDILSYYGMPYRYGLEPANNTTEWGFRLGARF